MGGTEPVDPHQRQGDVSERPTLRLPRVFRQSATEAPTLMPQPGPTQPRGAGVRPEVPAAPTRQVARAVTPLRRKPLIAGLLAALVVVALIPMFALVGQNEPDSGATSGPHVRQTYLPPTGASAANLDGMASLRQGVRLAYVNALMAKMTLDQEIGQLTMIGFPGASLSAADVAWIRQYQPGSVIFFNGNVQSLAQTQALTGQLQAASTVPMLVAVDQEGGLVDRMANIDGPAPSATALGAAGSTTRAEQQGVFDAAHLAAAGFNVNLAPVVDVSPVPGGEGALYDRIFGTTPSVVTAMAGAYLTGLQASGKVVGTLKHFPGLGTTATDPHLNLPTVTETRAQLEKYDWAPYRALIATGQVHMVMQTHILVPALDPTYPATMSSAITTGILRDELGFQGVIITDDMFMGAIRLNFPMDEVFTRAVLAGNDIICCTWGTDETAFFFNVMHQDLANGTIPKARIDASVRRILLLKLELGLAMPKVARVNAERADVSIAAARGTSPLGTALGEGQIAQSGDAANAGRRANGPGDGASDQTAGERAHHSQLGGLGGSG